MNVAAIMEFFKTLLDSEKRFILFSWIGFGVVIYFLYDQNTALETKIATHETACADVLKKAQESCQEQINLSRGKQQEQLDAFIIKSNFERDSIYRYFETTIRTLNARVNRGIKEVNELKDESTN